MAFTTYFEKVVLPSGLMGPVALVCSRCGALCTEKSSDRHGAWHRAREDRSPGDASATATTS